MKFRIIRGQTENVKIDKTAVQFGYTLTTEFSIENRDIRLPSQPKTAHCLKSGDEIAVACRSDFFKRSRFVGYAYKYDGKKRIYAINERWNYISAFIALLVSVLAWFFLPEQQFLAFLAFIGSTYYLFEAYQATIARRLLSE